MDASSYRQQLSEYQKRKQAYKAKYGKGFKFNQDYLKTIKKSEIGSYDIDKRIRHIQRMIRIINKRRSKFKSLAWMVYEYLDLKPERGMQPMRNVVNGKYKTDPSFVQARKLFSKYAIDMLSLSAYNVDYWMGAKQGVARVIRKRFTRSFMADQEAYRLWRGFVAFVAERNAQGVYDPPTRRNLDKVRFRKAS